jgi:peptidyl-prolyl cis-trans isomerase B (cyclophilin B)
LSSDPYRSRPRSSKKKRAVQAGGKSSGAGRPNRPATQRVGGGATRGGPASGGIPTAWWAIGAVVLFAVGVALAGGAIKFGGGGAASSDNLAYAGSGVPGGSPGSPAGSGSAAPGDSSSAAGSGATGGGIPASCPKSQPPAARAGSTTVVTIDTPKGAIELTLKADLSPIAVGNFVALASCGYYDNVVFHRVVPNFVIQGGDGQFGRTTAFDAGQVGTGGPGYEIQDEAVTTPYSRGTVAMARTQAPNSVGSQFFIVLSDDARAALVNANTYQIIGTVTKGMDVADAITAAAAGVEIPTQPIPMTKVTVSQPSGSGSPPSAIPASPSPS